MSWARSAVTGESRETDSGEHFVDHGVFISAVQQCQVDILPVTWQEALSSLGEGLTSIVSQSHVSIQSSFAFKRVKSGAPLEGEARLKAAISEMAILRYSVMRSHNNIINLEGLCWELDPDAGSASPVFVFEKAPLGNLRDFFGTEEGGSLDLICRNAICIGLAQALVTLQRCNIVHSDIKPDNILVFKSPEGILTPKLADFGFGSQAETDASLVLLERTPPWDAPEWHHGYFTLLAAKKTDVYSFGLLCLWVFFHDVRIIDFVADHEDFMQALEDHKENGDILNFVTHCLSEQHMDNSAQTESLSLFFKGCLSEDPEDRWIDVEALFRVNNATEPDPSDNKTVIWDPMLIGRLIHQLTLTEDRSEKQGASGEVAVLWDPLHSHFNFQLRDSLYHLSHIDYRVRKTVVHWLQSTAMREEECRTCMMASSFQLAICYHLGFGVPRSISERDDWLEKSGKGNDALEAETEYIKNMRNIRGFGEGKFKEFFDTGYINVISSAFRYHPNNQLDTVMEEYVREINDFTETLGKQHIATVRIKQTLVAFLKNCGCAQACLSLELQLIANIAERFGEKSTAVFQGILNIAETYREMGQYKDAEAAANTARIYFTGSLGPHHPFTLASIKGLAEIYALEGKFSEAEPLLVEVSEVYKALFGETHPFALAAMGDLAMVVSERGNTQKAEELLENLRKLSISAVGEMGSLTLSIVSRLAATIHQSGKFEKAGVLLEQVARDCARVFGEDHPETLNCYSNLARHYNEQGRFKQAEEFCKKVHENTISALGQEHPKSIVNAADIAHTQLSAGDYAGANSVLFQLQPISERSLGPHHPTTLRISSMRVQALIELAEWTQAEELGKDVIDKYVALHGYDHPDTLRTMCNVANAVFKRGDVLEAEHRFRQASEICSKVLGPNHPDTLAAKSNLGVAVAELKNFEEAHSIFASIRAIQVRELGEKHVHTSRTTANLAACIKELGRPEDALITQKSLVDDSISALGERHPATLTHQNNLAALYLQLSQPDLALEIFEKIAAVRAETNGDEHPETLLVLRNVATCYWALDREIESEKMFLDLYNRTARSCGIEHPHTKNCIINLVKIYEYQGRTEEVSKWKILLKNA